MKRLIVLIVAAAALAAFSWQGVATAAPSCTGAFEGTVLHGPNAGLSLVGTLALEVDEDGNVAGSLKTRGGSIPVTGRIEGQSIHLAFHLADGRVVEGVGPINKSDFAACAGITEGTLKGPDAGDTGNWGIVWGS